MPETVLARHALGLAVDADVHRDGRRANMPEKIWDRRHRRHCDLDYARELLRVEGPALSVEGLNEIVAEVLHIGNDNMLPPELLP